MCAFLFIDSIMEYVLMYCAYIDGSRDPVRRHTDNIRAIFDGM